MWFWELNKVVVFHTGDGVAHAIVVGVVLLLKYLFSITFTGDL